MLINVNWDIKYQLLINDKRYLELGGLWKIAASFRTLKLDRKTNHSILISQLRKLLLTQEYKPS